jgi:thiamine monophosphate synthase
VIEGDQQTRLDADRIAATGAPVVAHVAETDLAVAASKPLMRTRVGRALGSCEAVIAADNAAAEALRAGWIEPDDTEPIEVWPLGPTSAEQIASICRTALARRRG